MKKNRSENGQAIVTLLFIMVTGVAVITAVVIVAANNMASGSSFERGTVAYYAAESGVNNALLRILRNPSYAGEVLQINEATVNVLVTGNTITSVAQYGNSIRKIEAQTVYNENVLSIESWKEIK